MLVSCVIIFALAVPIGIAVARSRVVSGAVRPVLDLMQTMPAMVYLIPGIFFFGVGPVPGVVATIVLAMPPAVRLTELGIRQVDAELVEAAETFGTHPRRTLWRVQLPPALPTITAGVNGRRDPLADGPDRRRRAGAPGPAGRPSGRDRPTRAERAGRSRTGVRERSGQPLRGARPDRARTRQPVPALVRDPASTTVWRTARTGDGPCRRDHAARPAGRPERLPRWREL